MGAQLNLAIVHGLPVQDMASWLEKRMPEQKSQSNPKSILHRRMNENLFVWLARASEAEPSGP